MEHIIDFRPDGSVQALYSDHFSLGFLGPQHVTRASDIRFDPATQSWEIWLAHGDGFVSPREIPAGEWLDDFKTYEAARDFEVRFLNECRRSGFDPKSDYGLTVASIVGLLRE